MTSPVTLHVHPLSDVRQRLSWILARFRREGAAAEPVVFGSHRKPEAVLLPYEVYERYAALAREHAQQVEVPTPSGPEHDPEVAAYVDGKIDATELYHRMLARSQET